MNTLHSANSARLLSGVHVPCYVFTNGKDLARRVSQVVTAVIRERNALGQRAVLGLPTGSSPVGVYRELIRMHREEGLDFSNVVTFNLDEYYPMAPESIHSYHRYMRENLFNHINVKPEN